MKKILFAAVLFVASASVQMNAQSLKSILKSAASSAASSATTAAKSAASSAKSSTSSSISSIFNGLIGTSTVSSSSIVGTWTYSKPAVAFESSNLLSKAGGAVAANTIQNKLGNSLTKYGVKAGVSTFVFNSDGTFTAKLSKKTVTGKYTLSGSTVTFLTTSGTTIATANAAIKSSALQLTFKANKLLTFMQNAGALASASSTLSTVASLAKNYNGMQLGLQFAKK